MSNINKPLMIFYSYAHADETHREELEKHLSILRRQGIIADWHDRKILPGEDWERAISDNLESAEIILFLVSSDFLASDYCYDIEVKRAIERHESGEAVIIPVIVRPVDFTGAPFSGIQALPKDAKPVTTFNNPDEVWFEIAQGIRDICESIAGTQRNNSSGEKAIAEMPTEESEGDVLSEHERSDILFWHRMHDAFPGLRDVDELRGENAADRLEILFKEPIHQIIHSTESGRPLRNYPFWWFRGGSNMYIPHFERIESSRVLFDVMEIEIDRLVAVRRENHPSRDFVYVQTNADKPVGIYAYRDGEIAARLEHNIKSGYESSVYEEYGLWEGRPITRAEYDDGAAVIDGTPTRLTGADLRSRFLTPHNFMLCGREHVANQVRFDLILQSIFDDILMGTRTIDDLIDIIQKLPQPS